MGSERKPILAAVVLGAALLGIAPQVLAQSPADRETARTLMKQGDAAYESADYEAALKAYETAHGIMRVPSTGVALARAQEKLGHLLEARDTALSVTRLPAQPNEPAAFTEARAAAQELAQAVEPRIPSLTINVEGAPAERVVVTIDGAELPRNLRGVPRKLNSGKHLATASAPGFHQARAEIELEEGASEALTLRLEQSTGPTSESWPKTAGATAPPPAAEARPSISPLFYVGFGVGGAGVIVGSVTGILSLSKASSAKEHCDDNLCAEAAKGDIDSSKTLANVSNVGFAVGIVGIGVGVYGLLSSSGKSEQIGGTAKHGFEPLVGPRFAGVRGRF